MKYYTIYPLNLGMTIRDKSGAAYQKSPGTPCNLPIIAFYVTDGTEKILVDTGGDPADGTKHMPYTQDPEEFIDKALEKIGVKSEEITKVILTHLHWDHASNNTLFPNAVFYVQKKELQYAVAPLEIHKKYYDLPLIFQTEYVVLDGDAQIMDGISVVLTPGHSPGSQTVLVNTHNGLFALTGDLVTIYECWESTPKIANGLHTNLVEYYESFNKLEKLCDHILPGHDIKIFEKKMYP